MFFITLLLGLAGLGLVVLVHELGHFFAARAVGVEVEAFSIGWGPRIAGFRKGATEWKISAFPLGGYCKMKGEDGFRKALETKADTFPAEQGGFYGVSPWRRILIAISGPLANVFFAILVYILVSAFGYTIPTANNRIVLYSDFPMEKSSPAESLPADQAGLRSGDYVVSLGGKPIRDYSELQETVALSANKQLSAEIDRDGERLKLLIRPSLNPSGAGRIGVYPWIDPIVESVGKGSAAGLAGLEAKDRILAANGLPVRHTTELFWILKDKPERLNLLVERGPARLELPLILAWSDKGGSDLGIAFALDSKTIKAKNPIDALAYGFAEAWKTFSVSVKGLGLIFQKGINLLKLFSGPLRITYLVGQSAAEGLQSAGSGGLALPFNFLAFLSMGLFIMNLLPIPALDGGQILMFVVEALRRRSLKPLTVYRYQMAGAFFIFAILIFATVGDFLFFTAK